VASFEEVPELSELERFSEYELDVGKRVNPPDKVSLDPESDDMVEEAREKAKEQTGLDDSYSAEVGFEGGCLELNSSYDKAVITADEYTEELEQVFYEMQSIAMES
jgi:hypothetical protein